MRKKTKTVYDDTNKQDKLMSQGRTGLFWSLVSIMVFMIFIGYLLYNSQQNGQRVAYTPVIQAPTGEEKIKPADSGGRNVAYQNVDVYEGGENGDLAEQLQPAAIGGDKAGEPTSATKRYAIQLGAYRSYDQAYSAWRIIGKTHEDLFAGANFFIEKRDSNEKGIYFQLRVGSYADRNSAKAVCEKLKQRKQDCFLARL